mgnify:CR=1 FL=1
MDLKKFIKESGNEYASIVEEGVAAGDVHSYIDTGSYLFNALLSGSLSGGLPSNKITALAGESATGKTYFALGMVKQFLDANPDAGVLYFESESAIPKELIVGTPLRQPGVPNAYQSLQVKHISGRNSKLIFKSYEQYQSDN